MTDAVVYGIHAVGALLENPHRKVKKLILCEDTHNARLAEHHQSAQSKHISIEHMSMEQMNKRFVDLNHQGIVALATPQPLLKEQDIPTLLAGITSPALILMLDGITDPHNLGACLRVADGAGVHFVIIPKDKSASITPVVSKVASGAAESMPIVCVTNLVRAMEILKQHGIWIYGAAGETDQGLYDLDCSISLALVMGAEGRGLRRLTREHCDVLFALPMLGSVSSLNVSVATGISLYEAVRQRQ